MSSAKSESPFSKFTFESELQTPYDAREINALVVRIRKKFKVCVRPAMEFKKEKIPAIVIATLGTTEQAISQQLDSIADFLEDSGFGRIDTEQTILDFIDSGPFEC